MKQNGFAPIIILILIALAVVGYFGYKNFWPKPKTSGVTSLVSTPTAAPAATTDPTVNWKTYTNTKYNFSIQYPKEWYIQATVQNTDGAGYANVTGKDDIISIFLNKSSPVKPAINIGVQKLVGTLEQWVAKDQQTMEISHNPDYQEIKQYEVSLNGIKTLVLEATRGDNHTKTYYFKSENENYFISIAEWNTVNVDKSNLDQILSTFKFTK